MIKYQNYSLDKLPESAEDGEVFEFCNFTQAVAGTEIFTGVENLVFNKCNLVNCSLPTGAIANGCNTTQKSFCSHLHPSRGLTECADDCSHVVDSDEIWIDGVLVDTEYYYEDTVL